MFIYLYLLLLFINKINFHYYYLYETINKIYTLTYNIENPTTHIQIIDANGNDVNPTISSHGGGYPKYKINKKAYIKLLKLTR